MMRLPKMLMLGGVLSFFLGTLGCLYMIPEVIHSQVEKEKGLRPGGLSRGLFDHLPDPLHLKVYMFNVTNPLGVKEGEKPILQEVGPFIYDEYKWKTHSKDRIKDDTILYRPVNWFYWNKELSSPLTGNELVTIPNLLMLSIVMRAQADMPGRMAMVNKAVKELFQKPSTHYMTVSVQDVLFNGVKVNCTVKEFATKALCTKLEQEKNANLRNLGDNMFSFSFLGPRNGTEGGWIRAKRGIKDVMEVGRIVTYDDMTELEIWDGQVCNEIKGTDGSVHHPFRTPEDNINVFAGEICRSLTLHYTKSAENRGVPVYVYVGGFGDIPNTPSEMCFCHYNEEFDNSTCPKTGSMDLTKCMGSPVTLTLPHFYKADPHFLEGVDGMRPTEEDHRMVMEIEPITGSPLKANFRYQLNMEIENNSKIDVMKKLRVVMHPILWMEEGILLPEKYVNIFKYQLYLGMGFVSMGRWFFTAVGIGMFITGKVLHSKKKSVSDITPIDNYAGESPTHKKVLAFMRENNVEPRQAW